MLTEVLSRERLIIFIKIVMNIIAVVVTYNRIELLKRTVRCLQQNKPVSSIVVVNNGSTDATAEWLKTQSGLTVINQANVGAPVVLHRYAVCISGRCGLDLVHG